MPPFLYRACTQAKFQIPLAIAVASLVAVAVWNPLHSGADSQSIDRSTFITYLSAVASILALFCSLSLAWVLFVSQQNKSERLSTYDLLKARLSQAQDWLLSLPPSEDTELCLSLAYELNKHDLSDLPQTDLGDGYRAYITALDEALEGADDERRRFFMISMGHFSYIEQLLNRIGIISIRQVITKVFLDTLAKGLGLVGLAVFVLIASSIWFNELARLWLITAASFVGVSCVLLLVEVFADINRNYKEELDFIEGTPDEEIF